jgi:hypothetical protein
VLAKDSLHHLIYYAYDDNLQFLTLSRRSPDARKSVGLPGGRRIGQPAGMATVMVFSTYEELFIA